MYISYGFTLVGVWCLALRTARQLFVVQSFELIPVAVENDLAFDFE